MAAGRDFKGAVAVVTGSTQGLGEACAMMFAERGALGVVICGRSEERARRVCERVAGAGTKALFVPVDLGDVEAVRGIIRSCEATFGRVDHVVNSAGLTDRGNVLTTSPELFDRMFAINARAPFFLMQDAVRLMLRERIAGSIVNILSMTGHGGQAFLTPYAASKAALATLTKNIAFSLLPHRIRVNGLNIGWMDTPGEHAIQKREHDAPDDWLAAAEAQRPFGRLLKPDEVARAVGFLCSAESGMMTGSIVDFDQTVHGCWDEAPFPERGLV